MNGVNLIKEARERGLHPFHLLLLCARKTSSFDAVWPTVDVELLSQVLGKAARSVSEPPQESALDRLRGLGLSREEAHVISRMHVKDYYGGNKVPFDKLHKHVAPQQQPKRTRETMRSLVNKGWVDESSRSRGEDAAYSLIPDQKLKADEVDRICRDLEG